MGEECPRPGTGADQTMFFVDDHSTGAAPTATPSRCGPRHHGQSVSAKVISGTLVGVESAVGVISATSGTGGRNMSQPAMDTRSSSPAARTRTWSIIVKRSRQVGSAAPAIRCRSDVCHR